MYPISLWSYIVIGWTQGSFILTCLPCPLAQHRQNYFTSFYKVYLHFFQVSEFVLFWGCRHLSFSGHVRPVSTFQCIIFLLFHLIILTSTAVVCLRFIWLEYSHCTSYLWARAWPHHVFHLSCRLPHCIWVIYFPSPHKHMHGYRVFSVCLFLFGLLHHPTSICMVTGYFQFVCFYSDSFITPQAYAWLQGIFSLFVLLGLLHHPTSICMVTGYFQFVCFYSDSSITPQAYAWLQGIFSLFVLVGLLHHPTSICMVTGYFQFVCFYSDSFISPQAYAWLQGIFSLFVLLGLLHHPTSICMVTGYFQFVCFSRTPSSPHKHMHGYRVFSVCLFLLGLLHQPTSICMVTGYFQFVCFYSDSFISPQAYAWLQGIFSLFVLLGLLHHPTSICMVTGYFQFVCFSRTPSSPHKHMHGYRVFSVCLF